ncbi:holo-[acyl-carrier protein] synthase [Paenibacillus algorifonticola]|uniref:Holo-[acyl-carrier-protein] synthase n=1 Tax=Paenibacillus algorifonticola TaxID=684063 RepID=A0A1I2E4X0_9BACL|nr:holo-ACP synthase [Paenibacillus algorifonticola]SFE87561.1 holo-[acyl-carrier protein] synthase [Paenibacillus algorifonticola]
MIVGIGHDITDMSRMQAILAGRSAGRFLQRILTEQELKLAECYEGQRKVQFASGRFAAKEAVVKAFGCGIGGIIGFGDINILRSETGKPECVLSEAAWQRLELSAASVRVHITITHDRELASAVAIVERLA